MRPNSRPSAATEVRLPLRVVGFVALVLAGSACHQNGTVFLVETTSDTVDSNPGDGVCSDADGDCSLRAAVMEANALPGVEEIRLVDGATYTLTIEGPGEDAARSGDLDITSGVVVTGDATLGALFPERLLHVADAGGLVEIDGLDLVLRERPQVGGDLTELGVLVEGSTSIFSLRNSDSYDFGARWLRVDGGTAFIDSSAMNQVLSTYTGVLSVEGGGQLHLTNVSLDLSSEVRNNGGTLSIRHSTVLGRVSNAAPAQFDTIVANSVVTGGCYGSIDRGEGNLGFSCVTAGGPGPDDYHLLPLAHYGGGVRTVAVEPTSPALDGGAAGSCLPVDARGVARPFGLGCDSGAFEARPSADCGARGPGVNLRFCDFAFGALDGADAPDAELLGAIVRSARDADLSGVDFLGVRLTGAPDFSGANLDGVRLANHVNQIRIEDATLRDADLQFLRFLSPGAEFTGSVLREVEVTIADGVRLVDAQLFDVVISQAPGVDFSRVSGTGVFVNGSIAGANVEGADFSGFTFRNTSSGGVVGTPAALPPGAVLANGWLAVPRALLDTADLSAQDLSAASLVSARARFADFTAATFAPDARFADFYGANFDQADLSAILLDGARLSEASLVAVDLAGSSLVASRFEVATIVGSNFAGADLRNANFSNALVLWNTFDNTICPSGVNSDDNGGNCDGQFTYGAPQAPGAPVPEEFQGREAEFTTIGG